MAEFQEVIEQFKRLCDSANQDCSNCGLRNMSCSMEDIVDNSVEFEKRVISWAAEHPEPVYPTWYEFMRENKIIPDVLEDCGDYYKTIGKWLVKVTIKHDIAQKLGLKPKNG